MKYKAVFLDFYGTLVHEDDDIVPIICEQIKANSQIECSISDIGSYWWQQFSSAFMNSYGEAFQLQREISLHSLSKTIEKFESNCRAEELIKMQFEHWIKPKLYADTMPFLKALEGTPIYILSNIDTADVVTAIEFHQMKVTDVLTSEDVRAYKPRPELFIEALKRSKLNADEVLHIGDSIINDVKGAQDLGISAMWLNRLNRVLPDGFNPNYICKDLNEALHMLH